MAFLVAAHVADGVDGGDQPQKTGHQGKQHAQGFQLKAQGEPRQDFHHIQGGDLPGGKLIV